MLFRIGGSWINFDYDLNPRLWNALLTRIKILARMDISETSISQKGLILVNTDKGVDYKIDVSIRPAAEGSAITMRIKEHSYEKYIAAALSEDTAEGGPSFRKDSIAQIREGINSETETHRILPVEELVTVGQLQLFLGTSIVIFGGFGLTVFLMATFGGDEPSGFDSESFQAKTPTPVIQPTSSDSLANPSEGTWAGVIGLSVDPTPESFEKFVQNAITFITQITPLKEDGGTYRFDLQKSESLIAPYQGMFSKTFKISYGDDEVEIHYTWDISAELGLVKGKWEYQSVLVQGGRRVSTSKKFGADNKSLEFNRAWVRKEAINASPTTPTTIRYTNPDQLKEFDFGKRAAEILLMSSKSKAYRNSFK